MRRCFIFDLAVIIVFWAWSTHRLQARIPIYQDTAIFARTGATSWNLPNGSSIASATASLNDMRDVVIDVNFVGSTGNPGLFFGTWNDGQPQGGIVAHASDTILGDPVINANRQAAYTVGLNADPFVYDAGLMSSAPVNYPLGVTSSSNLQIGRRTAGRSLGIGVRGRHLRYVSAAVLRFSVGHRLRQRSRSRRLESLLVSLYARCQRTGRSGGRTADRGQGLHGCRI